MPNPFKESNIIIGSGPVIIENNQVLLNKESDDAFWKFPGGGVELIDLEDPENSLEATCAREVKEEICVDIKIILPLKSMFVPVDGEENAFLVLIHYLASYTGEIVKGEDIEEIRWFDIEKIMSGEYTNEAFAKNIVPVLGDYLG